MFKANLNKVLDLLMMVFIYSCHENGLLLYTLSGLEVFHFFKKYKLHGHLSLEVGILTQEQLYTSSLESSKIITKKK